MLDSHFIASRLPTNNGYTWTLPTRLGQMLHEIESQYGPRDPAWTILGVEFMAGNPQIWFPGDRKHVAIQLSTTAEESELRACYQLAHEAVHLLAPVHAGMAPVIEEGLATVYSEDFVRREFKAARMTDEAPYARAAASVRELLGAEPDAILRLRAVERNFTMMTADTFARAEIAVSEALISELLSSFVRE